MVSNIEIINVYFFYFIEAFSFSKDLIVSNTGNITDNTKVSPTSLGPAAPDDVPRERENKKNNRRDMAICDGKIIVDDAYIEGKSFLKINR